MPAEPIENRYDSSYFERIERWSSQQSYGEQWDQLLSELRIASSDRVLDLGCGTGALMRRIIRSSGARVQGVEPALAAARFHQGLSVTTARCEELPFESGVFDVVLMSHVLGHVSDPAAALREVHRILKPSGRIAVLTPNVRYVWVFRPLNRLGIVRHQADPTIRRYYSWSSLKRQLLQAGFRDPVGGYLGPFPEFLGKRAQKALPLWLRQRVFAIARNGLSSR